MKSSPLRIVSPANEFTCCLFSLVDDLVMVTVVVITMLIVLVMIRLMMSTVIVLPLV